MGMLINFCNAVLPTEAWLAKQPAGTVATYVAPKNDSGNDALTLAPGAGRQGNDCLLVASPDAKAGLPGFWLLKGRSNGRGTVANVTSNDGYLAAGQPANRLSFWLRFDDGFRLTSSANTRANVHVGTYHFDPAKRGVRKESNNWHFYHMITLRHDLAHGRWLHVVLNEMPQHQRSINGARCANNPTAPAGNYWDLLTRFYVDCVPNFGDPEIDYPVRMWVDDIELQCVEPDTDVTMRIHQQPHAIVAGQTTTLRVEAINHTQLPITGEIGHRSHYSWTPNLVDATTGKAAHKATVTLRPGSNEYQLLVTPRAALKAGSQLLHGVVFTRSSQLTAGNSSHADAAVQLNPFFGVGGPCDATVASASIRLSIT